MIFPVESLTLLSVNPPLGTLRVLSPNFLSPPAVPSIFFVASAELSWTFILPAPKLLP